jgi:uncharacterized Fe-S center protein
MWAPGQRVEVVEAGGVKVGAEEGDGDIMPWVKEEDCIGCGVCVDKCPPGAIRLFNEVARIDMSECIRCGVCHEACPQDAVRHDGEKVGVEVQANLEKTRQCMEACASYLGSEEEKHKCLQRMIKHFNKERLVAEKTLALLRQIDSQ